MNFNIVVAFFSCFILVNAQIVPPTGSMGDIQGMGQHDLWQKYLTYRLLYGDEAARIVMASQLATHLGNSPFANYYAGQFFDAPDSWWLASYFLGSNSMTSGTGLI